MRGARFYLAAFALHFALLAIVSCRETFWLIGRGYTVLPAKLESLCAKAETVAATALAEDLAVGNPARQILKAYLHFAGVESGYGYFAPNVPDSYKLVFELHYPEGEVGYDMAGLESAESNLRLAGYLDEVGGTSSEPMRGIMIKLLATSIWQRHPQAVKIRGILGALRLPTVAEFEDGKEETYEFLSAYDFTLSDPEP